MFKSDFISRAIIKNLGSWTSYVSYIKVWSGNYNSTLARHLRNNTKWEVIAPKKRIHVILGIWKACIVWTLHSQRTGTSLHSLQPFVLPISSNKGHHGNFNDLVVVRHWLWSIFFDIVDTLGSKASVSLGREPDHRPCLPTVDGHMRQCIVRVTKRPVAFSYKGAGSMCRVFGCLHRLHCIRTWSVSPTFWIRVSEEVVKTAFRLEPPSRLSQCNVVSLILDQVSKLQRFLFPPKCEIFEPFLLLEVGDYFWITWV